MPANYSQYISDLNGLGSQIRQLLIHELEGQGHIATGALKRSINHHINRRLDEIELQMRMLDYGITLDTGVPASNIPYSPGSGAGSSKFISGLIKWIKFKKMTGGLSKDINSLAHRIARTMTKEGMPTKGSYAFSKNTRRKGWISHTFNNYKDDWVEQITDSTQRLVISALDSILMQLSSRFELIELN